MIQGAMTKYLSALLILTRPLSRTRAQLANVVDSAAQLVSRTLYVHIQPGKSELPSVAGVSSQPQSRQLPFGPVPVTSEVETFVQELYACGAFRQPQLDIRILLSHVSNSSPGPFNYHLEHGYELVLVDSTHWHALSQQNSRTFVDEILKVFPGQDKGFAVQVLQSQELLEQSAAAQGSKGGWVCSTYSHVALGGTMDRLHAGHKVLLGQSCVICDEKLTVGVTDQCMNQKKTLCELIQPIEERMEAVTKFLQDTKPSLDLNVVPIKDPFGPTITDPSVQCLVVSEETKKGGVMINEERKKRGMAELAQVCIPLIEDRHRAASDEEKISSSSMRKRLLGSLLRPVQPKPGLAARPYILGMTGGIGSGKSSVCRRLQGLGAAVVDCDALGHQAYAVGSDCHAAIVQEFGSEVVSPTGEIDRRKLGAIVFSDKKNLTRLNQLVWPEIARLATAKIDKLDADVVVLDAAVLLEAGWEAMVHEVWTCVVPSGEAVKRIMERNKLSEEEARKRVDSQISNAERVERSNVVLSTLWEYEYTQLQVERAWALLQERKGQLPAAHV